MSSELWALIFCSSHIGWWNPVQMPPHVEPRANLSTQEEWLVFALGMCMVGALAALMLFVADGPRASVDALRRQIGDLRAWWRDPWRRHGGLIAGLPLTRADATVDGDLVAVSGRVVGGGPVGDEEADAQRVIGHLVLDDGSSVRIQIGRPGAGLVGESFSIGDLVFALGVAAHIDGAAHPFRHANRVVLLLPGDDGLFLVVREPRELACVRMAERASKLRRALVPPPFVIAGTIGLVFAIVYLLLR
ncbi:MAG: hypothetical protein QM820_28935 [Minicystis sp.]